MGYLTNAAPAAQPPAAQPPERRKQSGTTRTLQSQREGCTMTSRNIDPVTGRAVGDDVRDPIGPGSPEGSGGDGTEYATDPDAALPQLGERDHTAGGVGSDPDAAEPQRVWRWLLPVGPALRAGFRVGPSYQQV